MKKYIEQAYVFLMVSSADPRKSSLTVRALALGVVPYIMQVTGMACSLGVHCVIVDPTLVDAIVTSVTDITFYTLTLVSVIGTIWGLIRKLFLTLKGEHAGLGALKRK